jgi:hypothetical protein
MATTQQIYSLTDLFESINDIHYQNDEGGMDAFTAYSLARMCCNEFLNNTYNNKEALFLCRWNNGDLIQTHTKDTLVNAYKDTNLFDNDMPFYNVMGDELAISLREWLDTISTEHKNDFDVDINCSIFCDNFKIQRIK